MKDKAAPEAAVYAEHLWNLGFRSFGAISHAFKLDAVSMELLVDETDLGARRAVRAFAGRHVGEPLSFSFPCLGQAELTLPTCTSNKACDAPPLP